MPSREHRLHASAAGNTRRARIKAQVLAVVFIGSLIGYLAEQASIGDTSDRRARAWWGISVNRAPDGSHRFKLHTKRATLGSELDRFPRTGTDGRLVIIVDGWSTEEFANQGHWLLDGLALEHSMKLKLTPLSGAPESAPAIVLDDEARARIARMLDPVLTEFALRPATIRNGYTETHFDRPRLALRVSMLAVLLVSAALLIVTVARLCLWQWRVGCGMCQTCGYDLKGIDDHAACPECGVLGH